MSLKAFHLIFITAACALAFGCGVWGLKDYWSANGQALDLVFGLGSFAAGVALILYERYFLKKLKDIGYL
ncbi:MAG TPA: hypothetical protein VG146_15930 [Verrucomicrobiae bacterium]|nr:hypothetical protein [Verrucomicrobiae bacterium]